MEFQAVALPIVGLLGEFRLQIPWILKIRNGMLSAFDDIHLAMFSRICCNFDDFAHNIHVKGKKLLYLNPVAITAVLLPVRSTAIAPGN